MTIKIILGKKIDITKLGTEYAKAGFHNVSSYDDLYILVDDANDQAAVQAIYDAHDPNPSAAELAAIARKTYAITEARLAAELKALTPAQAVAYIENNVTNIATAKAVLKIMARMLIAMRNELWPGLPDE